MIKIIENGDSSILGVENHKELFLKLYDDYKKLNPNGESSKVLDLSVRISSLELKQNIINLCLEGLKFDKSNELLDILKLHGYKLDESDYFNEILRVEKQSKSINIKVDELKRQLPKSEVQTNVDEVILSYCMIAGLTFDTNQITVTQFYGLQNLVNDKIKRLENGK